VQIRVEREGEQDGSLWEKDGENVLCKKCNFIFEFNPERTRS
jgi:hypothetical protein